MLTWFEHGPPVTKPAIATAASVVAVEYSYFSVEDGAVLDGGGAVARAHSGLVGATGRSAVICTGLEYGWVHVAVQAWHACGWPGVPDLSQWDDVVEVPLHCQSGELMVFSPSKEIEPALPSLSLEGPGDYRLRVHARDRDEDRGLSVENGLEEFLLQVWPAFAPEEGEWLLRLTDSMGLENRRSLVRWRRKVAQARRAAAEGGSGPT